MRSLRLPLCFALYFCAACQPEYNERFERKLSQELREAREAGTAPPWAGCFYVPQDLFGSESLVLSPSGYFTYEQAGCIRSLERWGGRIEVEEQHLQLVVEHERAGVGPPKRLRIFPWDETAFLFTEEDLPRFVSRIEWARRGDKVGLGVFQRSDKPSGSLPGDPELPEPWGSRARFGIVRTECIEAHEIPEAHTEHKLVFELILEGGEHDGLWEGQTLRNEERGFWATVLQVKKTTIAEAVVSRTSPIRSEDLIGFAFTNH